MAFPRTSVPAALIALAFTSCSFGTDPGYTTLSVRMPGKPAPARVFDPILSLAPGSVAGFDCLAVNVMGKGIVPPSGYNPGDFTFDALYAGSSCSYPGINAIIPNVMGETKINLRVPTGPRRVIQVAGLVEEGSTICSVSDLDDPGGDGGSIYELGRTVVDLYRDFAVSVPNTYDSLTAAQQDLRKMNCGDDSGDYPSLIQSTGGLVAYWRLEETDGALAANSGSYIGALTLSGGALPGGATSPMGTPALRLPANTMASIAAAHNFVAELFSFEIWMKVTTCVSNGMFLHMRDNAGNTQIGLGCNGSNLITFLVKDDLGNTYTLTSVTNGMNDGTWHHIVGVKESISQLRLYVDGIEESSANGVTYAGNFTFPSALATEIGFNSDGPNIFQPGDYSHAAIYERALTAAEVQAHYAKGSGP
ncbi:MAG TPA: LamG domain-containing protein [Bdellovibrionota bacterium]|nr:LamG domain-containing protein [Bdellovibrionota bacterium]